jgi:Ran GTPase-activating protein (RanGAP) involved in mRNA processing and transport
MESRVSDYYQEPVGDWHDLNADILRRIITNDHGVVGLRVTESFIDGLTEDNDYGEESGLVFVDLCEIIGVAIANNRWLQKLVIDARMIELDEILPVLQGIASNRSIEHLRLMYLPEVDITTIFAPFFVHNRSLRCIEILASFMPQNIGSSFLPALSQCTQLERFELRHNNYGYGWGSDLIPSGPPVDGQVACVIKSLRENHPNMMELSLGGLIEMSGYVELANLLRRSSKVVALYLESCDIDDESFAVLSVPLVRGIKTFSINGNGSETISATGWRVFSSVLRDKTCRLEEILIVATNIDDEGAISLGDALAKHDTVKSVSLRCCVLITSAGWRGFAKCLRDNSALEEIVISSCHNRDDEENDGLDREGVIAIGESLAMNTTLKKLVMSHNTEITSDGWTQLFYMLLHSKCSLEELDVSRNSIDDEGAAALVDVLVTMRDFHTLHLRDSNFTAIGLHAFTQLLQPSSKVTTLDLGKNDFSDEVINDFADMLANNSTLTTLHIGGDEITDRSWAALSHALCNKSSIENTFSSNHTLHTLEKSDDVRAEIPEDLSMLLRLNKNLDKASVRRQKILIHHFHETVRGTVVKGIPKINGMSRSTLPSALEWMGRDALGFSVMYKVVRGIPTLFETKFIPIDEGKKRKHPSLDSWNE